MSYYVKNSEGKLVPRQKTNWHPKGTSPAPSAYVDRPMSINVNVQPSTGKEYWFWFNSVDSDKVRMGRMSTDSYKLQPVRFWLNDVENNVTHYLTGSGYDPASDGQQNDDNVTGSAVNLIEQINNIENFGISGSHFISSSNSNPHIRLFFTASDLGTVGNDYDLYFRTTKVDFNGGDATHYATASIEIDHFKNDDTFNLTGSEGKEQKFVAKDPNGSNTSGLQSDLVTFIYGGN